MDKVEGKIWRNIHLVVGIKCKKGVYDVVLYVCVCPIKEKFVSHSFTLMRKANDPRRIGKEAVMVDGYLLFEVCIP